MDTIKLWIMIIASMTVVAAAHVYNWIERLVKYIRLPWAVCLLILLAPAVKAEEITHILGTIEYTVAAQVECKGNPTETFDNCGIMYYHYVKLEDRERVLLHASDKQPKEEDMSKYIMKYLLSTTVRR